MHAAPLTASTTPPFLSGCSSAVEQVSGPSWPLSRRPAPPCMASLHSGPPSMPMSTSTGAVRVHLTLPHNTSGLG